MSKRKFASLFIYALFVFSKPCLAQDQCFETCSTYAGTTQCWMQCVAEPTYPESPPAWTGCLPFCEAPETPNPVASIWEQRKTIAENAFNSVLDSALNLDTCNNMLSTLTISARDVARRWQSIEGSVRISRMDRDNTLASTNLAGNLTLYPAFFTLGSRFTSDEITSIGDRG